MKYRKSVKSGMLEIMVVLPKDEFDSLALQGEMEKNVLGVVGDQVG